MKVSLSSEHHRLFFLGAELVHDGHAYYDYYHHDKRDSTAQVGIIGAAQELHLDEVAQKHNFGPSQQVGYHESADRRNENHSYTGENTREAQWENHLAKYSARRRPQIPGCLQI